MRRRRDAYFMFDIEASGTRLGYHDLIQFGGVVICGSELTERIPFPEYRQRQDLPVNLVAPMLGNAPEPSAMEVNGLDWDQVKEYGEDPERFVARFQAFVEEVKERDDVDRVVLAGHGLVFDWSMLKLMYDHYRNDWPCHYSGLCLKAFFGGLTGSEYIDSSMTEMEALYSVAPNEKKHDAQADADHQATLLQHVFHNAGIGSVKLSEAT